ncbi:MAG: MFS transporter [Candidatus Eremiobacteraeota bacterium]|nr:MFS transporter [Candidatus Eremiobacteraeota bacterium]
MATSGFGAAVSRVPLTRQQIAGFWAAWSGWTLDGMDSVIYALVLAPALTELLPRSGMAVTPATIGFVGSILFATFLAGWGCAFIWGPLGDRFGRTKMLALTILMFSVFTGAAALSQNVWELGIFRFLAGVGIGGEWAMAGTYVAEAWPESRREQGAGYLQTGYYTGFFIAAALNFTVGAAYGWRAMFLCGLAPVVVSLYTLSRVKEPAKWVKHVAEVKRVNPLAEIFSPAYRRRTIVNTVLVAVAIIGLWGGSVYVPTAIITLAKAGGALPIAASRLASLGTAILSVGTILGCLALPQIAIRFGRRRTLALFFGGMAVTLVAAFGWAFYLPNGLVPFMAVLFFLGISGANFAMFSLWLPEQYPTYIRATAFAFATSFARCFGAIINFGIGGAIACSGTLGAPVAFTAIAFGIGLLVIPAALETRGRPLPD